jgi:hypothetical protein
MMIFNIYNYFYNNLYTFTVTMATVSVQTATYFLTIPDIQEMCKHLPKPIVAHILSHISTEIIHLCRKYPKWHNFIWGKNGLSGIGVFLNTQNEDVISYAIATMSRMDITIPFLNVRLPPNRISLLTKYLRAYVRKTQLHQHEDAQNSVTTVVSLVEMYMITRKDDECKNECQDEKQVNPICVVMYSLLNDNDMTLEQTFEVINRLVPILTRKYLFNINKTITYIIDCWGVNNPIVLEMVAVLQK